MCAGLSARPFFAARHEVMLQLMRLATHCRDSQVRRLWAPARMRPSLGDCFLMNDYPRPLEGGLHLVPYAGRPPRAPPKSVPLAAPRRSSGIEVRAGAGGGTQGLLCLEHGAPSCPRCRSVGWGISRCGRARHEGHADPSAGPRCPRIPPWVAPGRQVLVPEDWRAGAAPLSSCLGRSRPPPRPSQPRAPLRPAVHGPPKEAGRMPHLGHGPPRFQAPKMPQA